MSHVYTNLLFHSDYLVLRIHTENNFCYVFCPVFLFGHRLLVLLLRINIPQKKDTVSNFKASNIMIILQLRIMLKSHDFKTKNLIVPSLNPLS